MYVEKAYFIYTYIQIKKSMHREMYSRKVLPSIRKLCIKM